MNPEQINPDYIGYFIVEYIPHITITLLIGAIFLNVIGVIYIIISTDFILEQRRRENAVLLAFGNRFIYPEQKLKLLKEQLIPNAQKANIENIIVDTAVLDLVSVYINIETTRLVKNELGIPTGFAPSNAVYRWNYVKKYGENSRCGAIASLMTYCASAGSDFILFGGVKFAKCVIPSIALISGINSYYRNRILRKPISEKTPLKYIFK